MRGIILAGGSGTRLYPITKGTSKQLLSIYNKPMIYYPISILMLSNIKEILIITTSKDLNNYKNLLGNGNDLGIKFSYKVQDKPNGIAEAFTIGEKFIGDEDVCLVLGDNIFYGHRFSELLNKSMKNVTEEKKANIFGYYVKDPENYGIAYFNKKFEVVKIIEKPKNSKSNFAVVGLYYYPNNVIKIAKKIKPSKRGELEISSINDEYVKKNKLNIKILGRGFTWLDTGTHDSLLEASNFVRTTEKHSGFKIACLEEIAYKKRFINKKQLNEIIKNLDNLPYSKYLKNILNDN